MDLTQMTRNDRIDLHTHVLPEMDDGSDGPATSVHMLEMLSAQGISTVCATPHYYRDREEPEQFERRREAAFRALDGFLQNGLPKVCLGSEVRFFRGIGDFECLDLFCMQGTKTLLLEMPFSEWQPCEIEEVVRLQLDREYQVILAHPERYCFSTSCQTFLQELAQLHVGFQVNADTLIHFRTRPLGIALLKAAAVPLLGSDCHNLGSRLPQIGRAREVIRKKLGMAFLSDMDCHAARLLQEARVG